MSAAKYADDIILVLQGVESDSFKYGRSSLPQDVRDDGDATTEGFAWFWDEQHRREGDDNVFDESQFQLAMTDASVTRQLTRTWTPDYADQDALREFCSVGTEIRSIEKFINEHRNMRGRVAGAVLSGIGDYFAEYHATILSIPSLVEGSCGEPVSMLQLLHLTRPMRIQVHHVYAMMKTAFDSKGNWLDGGPLLSHLNEFMNNAHVHAAALMRRLFVLGCEAYSMMVCDWVNLGMIQDDNQEFFLSFSGQTLKFTNDMLNSNANETVHSDVHRMWHGGVLRNNELVPAFLETSDIDMIFMSGILVKALEALPTLKIDVVTGYSPSPTKHVPNTADREAAARERKKEKQLIVKKGIDDTVEEKKRSVTAQRERDAELERSEAKHQQEREAAIQKAKEAMLKENDELYGEIERTRKRIEWQLKRHAVHGKSLESPKPSDQPVNPSDQPVKPSDDIKMAGKESKSAPLKLGDGESIPVANPTKIMEISDPISFKTPERKSTSAMYTPKTPPAIPTLDTVSVSMPGPVSFLPIADDVPPFRIFENSLLIQIRQRYSLLSAVFISHLFQTVHLIEHLNALREYLLLFRGDFKLELITGLSTLNANPNPVSIVSVLNNSISNTSAVDDKYSSSVSISVSSEPRSPLIPGQIDIFDKVNVTYKLPVLLSIIIPPSSQKCYRELSHSLLQLSRAIYNVDRLASQLNKCRTNSTRFYRELCLFRMEMHGFLRVYAHYVNERVSHVAWHHLMSDIHSAKTVQEMAMAHETFISMMMAGCFLTTKTSGILTVLNSMVGCCVLFCETFASNRALFLPNSGASQTQMEEVIAILRSGMTKYRKYMVFLLKVLHKLSAKGAGDAFKELIELLNFNGYYDDDDVVVDGDNV